MGKTETVRRNEAVVAAYHRFREADSASHRRVRAATGMSENELRLVQYVLYAHREGHDVKPTEIAKHLTADEAKAGYSALYDIAEGKLYFAVGVVR